MSQLSEQLLNSSKIPVMMPMGQNINMITGVPISPQLQNQTNMNQNPMGINVIDQRPQQNPDTSN